MGEKANQETIGSEARFNEREPPATHASRLVQLITFLAIVIPLLGLIAAPFFLVGLGVSLTEGSQLGDR